MTVEHDVVGRTAGAPRGRSSARWADVKTIDDGVRHEDPELVYEFPGGTRIR